jgi:transglutaminase-like putative cysteine protease
MRFSRPSLPHLWVCGFVACSAAALALALKSGLAWAMVVIPVAALWASISLPRFLVASLPWIARGGAFAIIFAGLILSIYPVAPERELFAAVSVVAHLLLVCGGVMLMARLPPGGGLIPAMIGAVTAAFMQPEPSGLRAVAAGAFAFLVAWLITVDDEGKAARSVRWVPLVVFVAIALATLVGVARLLPWAQPQVELYAARMISNDLEAAVGLSTESRLGEVEQLAQSKRIALRYYADRPDNLRVRVFTGFDGRAWKSDPRRPRPLSEVIAPVGDWPSVDETPGRVLGAPGSFPAAGLRAARLVVRSPERGTMPAPAHTAAVKVEEMKVELSPSGSLLPAGRAAIYAVLFADAAPAEATPGPEMLAVPGKVDPRLRELAASLAAEGLTPAEIVERVVGHFHSGYRYSLNVGAFRTADPLAEFVFDKKKGYCEYFASAATLLLRLSGVPARYVTGYAVRPFHRSGDHYVVRDSDAHAWTEAYIEGRGWVEADATPAGDYEAVHGNPANGGLLASLGALYDEVAALVAQGGISGLLRGAGRVALAHPIALAWLLAGVIAFRFRHRFRRAPKAAGAAATKPPAALTLTPAMRDLLSGLDALLAHRGSPRRPSRAPLEHVLDPTVALGADERSTCLRAVHLLYATLYGGCVPDANELAAVTASLAASRSAHA